MAFSLISHVGGGTAINGGTVGPIDTTGANLLVMTVSAITTTAWTISDNKGNTWTPRTLYTNASTLASRIYYVASPTVGSGHTFTIAGTTIAAAIFISAWSGAAASSPYDVENGATATSVSSIQPGSVTPTQNNELLITGVAVDTSSITLSINSSFTITDQATVVGGTSYGGAHAYLVQTSASAVNPTWTLSGSSSNVTTAIATFKAAAASVNTSLMMFGAD